MHVRGPGPQPPQPEAVTSYRLSGDLRHARGRCASHISGVRRVAGAPPAPQRCGSHISGVRRLAGAALAVWEADAAGPGSPSRTARPRGAEPRAGQRCRRRAPREEDPPHAPLDRRGAEGRASASGVGATSPAYAVWLGHGQRAAAGSDVLDQPLELGPVGKVVEVDGAAGADVVERGADELERRAGELGPREAVEGELERVGVLVRGWSSSRRRGSCCRTRRAPRRPRRSRPRTT